MGTKQDTFFMPYVRLQGSMGSRELEDVEQVPLPLAELLWRSGAKPGHLRKQEKRKKKKFHSCGKTVCSPGGNFSIQVIK
jgi:hypothetical protein